MDLLKTFALFVASAIAEIVGCCLPYLWLKRDGTVWLLIPAAASLALFARLLTLHPTAAGKIMEKWIAYAFDAPMLRSHMRLYAAMYKNES